MSEDEKIGQLFLPIAFSSDENYLRYEMLRYCNNNETLDALVEKLMGRDTFRGKSPTDPFCGKEYLRY